MSEIVLPFLKWAGGKRWLYSNHPNLFAKDFENYIEPFLGGGAVFFHLKPKSSILADSNPDLISTYKCLREDWKAIQCLLAKHQTRHCKEYYYQVRGQIPNDRTQRAARFIYLNRTCWNGLYRVNLKGVFNVPIGTKSSVILSTDDFEKTSRLLSNSSLEKDSFESTIEKARCGDFLFVDPPYTMNHNLNGFLKYNEKIFSWEDQEKLAVSLRAANKRGVKVLLTNADHKSVRSLYENDFEIIRLERKSIISGKPQFRKQITEIAIKNY